jgi:hypothetical protein
MSAAVGLRDDFTAADLRRLAGKAKDTDQARQRWRRFTTGWIGRRRRGSAAWITRRCGTGPIASIMSLKILLRR